MSRARLPIAWSVALGACCATVAHAQVPTPRGVRIVTTEGLPFSQAELRASLALRIDLPAGEDPRPGDLEVRVAPLSPGAVRVEFAGLVRDVDLAARRGADAARTVALIIVDMAEATNALPVRRDIPPRPSPVAPVMPDRAPARPWFLGAEAVGHLASFDTGPVAGGGLRGILPIRGRWGATLGAGVATADGTFPDGTDTASLLALPVRLGVSWSTSFLEVQGGPALLAYRATGPGDSARAGAVVGAFLAILVVPRLGWPVVPYGGLGLDVWSRDLSIETDATPPSRAISTQRLAPSLVLGLALSR